MLIISVTRNCLEVRGGHPRTSFEQHFFRVSFCLSTPLWCLQCPAQPCHNLCCPLNLKPGSCPNLLAHAPHPICHQFLSAPNLLNLPVLLPVAELKPFSHDLGQSQQTVDCRFLLHVPLLCTVSPPVSKTVLLQNRECSPATASPPSRPTSISCSGVMRLASGSLAECLSSYVWGTRSLSDSGVCFWILEYLYRLY